MRSARLILQRKRLFSNAAETAGHPMRPVWEQRALIHELFKCKAKADAKGIVARLLAAPIQFADEGADRTISTPPSPIHTEPPSSPKHVSFATTVSHF